MGLLGRTGSQVRCSELPNSLWEQGTLEAKGSSLCWEMVGVREGGPKMPLVLLGDTAGLIVSAKPPAEARKEQEPTPWGLWGGEAGKVDCASQWMSRSRQHVGPSEKNVGGACGHTACIGCFLSVLKVCLFGR